MLNSSTSVVLALVALLSAPLVVTGQMSSIFFIDDVDSNSTDVEESCESITDIICADDRNLVALCEAVAISGLSDDLDEDAWTIFAPTDSAFEALGRDNLDALVFGNDTVPLTDLLLFHIVAGESLTSDLMPCEAGNNLLVMANGDESRTICMGRDPAKPIEQRGMFNERDDAPKFIEKDIMACNGVVHILDKVMLYEPLGFDIPDAPPAPPKTESEKEEVEIEEEEEEVVTEEEEEEEVVTEEEEEESILTPASGTTGGEPEEEPECLAIGDLACSTSDLSTLCTLLLDNGLLEVLNEGSESWTVFAPTNAAFDNAPKFSAGTDIAKVLKGHLVQNAEVEFEDLICTEKLTMLNGKQTRTVCKNGKTYQKGKENTNEERPEIVESNIVACNGIVHVVDQVILSFTDAE